MGTDNIVSFNKPSILFFFGENYKYWSIIMKIILQAYYLWEVIDNGYVVYDNFDGGVTTPQRNGMRKS